MWVEEKLFFPIGLASTISDYSIKSVNMRVVLALILAASASAFAPAAQTTKSAALSAIPVNKEVGVQAPLGFFEYVNIAFLSSTVALLSSLTSDLVH
jgi:hypothetical protein